MANKRKQQTKEQQHRGPFPFSVYRDSKMLQGRNCKTPERALMSAVEHAVSTTAGRKSRSGGVYQVVARVTGRVLFEIRPAPNRKVLYIEHVAYHWGQGSRMRKVARAG